MKRYRKLLAALAALAIAISMSTTAFAAESNSADLIRQMINYYRHYQASAETDIARLNVQLAEIDPEQAEDWKQIMDYWIWLNREMTVTPDVLPDGLPEDDSLCIVVLGYALNRNGSMQPELIGRLKTALASAKKYPNAYILCTGGGTARNNAYATEAGQMAKWLKEQGIQESRIIIEDDSKTTVQNAQFSCRILASDYPQIRSLAMVSSDYHLAWGSLLFHAQSVLSGYDCRIAGNAGYMVGAAGWDIVYQQVVDLSVLSGVSIGSTAKPSLSKLTGINAYCAPTYQIGGALDLTVTADYDTGYSRNVTANTFVTGFEPNREGHQTITLTYTENGVASTATAEIEVLPRPTEPIPETENTAASENTAADFPTASAPPKEAPSILYPLAVLTILLILLVIILRKKKSKR